jgi:hypothetical protein
MLPHAQASRRITQVSCLKNVALLDAGKLDDAIELVASNIRLARDVRPRGGLISQLVACASTNLTINSMVKPILVRPGLTTAQCDRLLAILAEHETKSIDGISEGLKAEYVLTRSTLHELTARRGGPRSALDPKYDAIVEEFSRMIVGDAEAERLTTLMESLRRATPAQFSQAVDELNRLYRGLMLTTSLSYSQRDRQIKKLIESFPKATGPEALVAALMPALGAVSESETRIKTTTRAAEALVAIRRWHIIHKQLPTTLAEACREAKLRGVPADPFADRQPLKYRVMQGQPLVYSIGKDGQDDRGEKDCRFNTQPGDLLFPLTLPF